VDWGTYAGKDVSGVKFAYVMAPPDALLIYVDAPASKAALVENLAKRVFDGFGKLQGVRRATISLSGKGGRYAGQIGAGKIADFACSPVMGGDGKTPVILRNVLGDPYDDLWQAKVEKARFQDGTFRWELSKESSALYVDDLRIRKRY
jgi:hypothetical protein